MGCMQFMDVVVLIELQLVTYKAAFTLAAAVAVANCAMHFVVGQFLIDCLSSMLMCYSKKPFQVSVGGEHILHAASQWPTTPKRIRSQN